MRFAVSIVQPPRYLHSEAFREVAESLHWGLTALGHDSVLTYRLHVAHRRHIVLGSNLLPGFDVRLAPDAILYNLEQVQEGSSWLKPELLALFCKHPVWDYSRQNLERLSALGVERTVHVPVGYSPVLERIAARAEDIDVLFVGSLNPRREAVLEALEAKGLRVQRAVGIYGAARDALIARAKIVLNLHYYEAKVFEVVRVSYLLANGRFVVSESGAHSEEERTLKGGMVFAPYDQLVEACLDGLAQPEMRARVAMQGQALFRKRDVRSALAAAIGVSP